MVCVNKEGRSRMETNGSLKIYDLLWVALIIIYLNLPT